MPHTPSTQRRLALTPLLGLGLQAAAPPLHAQRPVQLRVGSLVPKNSPYHQALLELGESWRTAQGGNARFTVFTDGSQGGEAELARRMRIGQLQGALLSVVGLHEIEPSIGALQSLPLLFRNWEEVDYVREKMRPAMEKKFLDKGFVVLAWLSLSFQALPSGLTLKWKSSSPVVPISARPEKPVW